MKPMNAPMTAARSARTPNVRSPTVIANAIVHAHLAESDGREKARHRAGREVADVLQAEVRRQSGLGVQRVRDFE